MTDEQFLKVKELREITGRDMMSCTKALNWSKWDIQKAVKWLSDTSILTTCLKDFKR